MTHLSPTTGAITVLLLPLSLMLRKKSFCLDFSVVGEEAGEERDGGSSFYPFKRRYFASANPHLSFNHKESKLTRRRRKWPLAGPVAEVWRLPREPGTFFRSPGECLAAFWKQVPGRALVWRSLRVTRSADLALCGSALVLRGK